MRLILLFWLQAAHALAFPKKLLELTLQDKAFHKEVFLFADRHNLAMESTGAGKNAVAHVDEVIDGLDQDPRLAGLPLLWEHSGRLNKKCSPVFIAKKGAAFLSKQNQKKSGSLAFTPIDRQRSSTSRFRRFLLKLVYDKKSAEGFLAEEKNRKELVLDLREHFGYGQKKSLVEELFQSCQAQLPTRLSSKTSEHLAWYRQKIQLVGESLEAWQVAALDRDLVLKTFHNVLVYGAADLELLVNVLCHKNAKVLVYSGKGHVDRVQKILESFGFARAFELESSQFLPKEELVAFSRRLAPSTF